MKVVKAQDYDEISKKAASYIAAQVQLKPSCVLGLATGSTPYGTYQELIRYHREEDL
ncbi:MAG: glucosamine-6-phosphate deaminase, partial [Chloroflexi bacterium]|nr:glucosamine-6-phosphate deaminase [Chloroflexota bacterium]